MESRNLSWFPRSKPCTARDTAFDFITSFQQARLRSRSLWTRGNKPVFSHRKTPFFGLPTVDLCTARNTQHLTLSKTSFSDLLARGLWKNRGNKPVFQPSEDALL